jgi:hypothetical protein
VRTGLALALIALAIVPASASAQTGLGDVLGTVILQNTLTNLGLPQITQPAATPDPETQPEQQQQTTTTVTTPSRSASSYCKSVSNRHARGQCVAAMRKLQKGAVATPAAACKKLSRKHVKGMKKTPYSACVSAGTKLLMDVLP